MSFEEYKNLWVFVETEENEVKPVGYELLKPGRELADKMGANLVAVVIGGKVEDIAKKAIEYGADEAILVEGDEYYNYTTDAYSIAMKTLVDKYKPSAILIGATNNGRDLGPKMACDLNTGLTADCTAVDYDEETGVAKKYGEEKLLDCLERNEKNGIVYHRNGINGDYDDFDDVEQLMDFILTGVR
mgnify:CR=1 FL=1